MDHFDDTGLYDKEYQDIVESGPSSQERTDLFYRISEIQDDDHEESKRVKAQIRKLLDAELDQHNFEVELSEQ